MPSSGIKKIIHCVCPLSTDGIPIPFSTHTSDANLPPSPPTTPNHFSDKTQTVPLNIYYPSKELFNVRSRPSWYMIHAAASLSLAGYDQSICIDSRPSKHASVDRDLYAFVVNVLDPLFQVSPTSPSNCNKSMVNMWKNYINVNIAYAEALAARYRNGDIVWIHDYQLLMVPHYLRQILPNAKIGMSIYANFPYYGHLASIYECKSMLQSILLADHIGFQTKLDTRHFATACTQLLDMDCPPSSKQVGVFPSGVDNQLLLKSSVLKRAKEIRNLFPHRQIIFCRDTHVANVIRTLAAFSQLFSKDRYLMNHLVLIHLCSARVPASDLTAIPEIVRQINQLYGNTDFVPVHFYHQELDREEREALMAAADLGLFLGSQSSTLTSAKEFVLSQYERHAPLVMSQESSLVIPNGVITAIEDPSDIPALVTALHDTLTLCSIDSEKRYESLYKFVLENDAITCAHRFIETLVDHETRPLYTQQLIEAYKAASGKNLIIVCDNNELTAPTDKVEPSNPSTKKLIPYLESLSQDNMNCVYLVSGRTKDDLDIWSKANPHSFGLGAEYGAFVQQPSDASWKTTSISSEISKKSTDWRELINKLFQKYVQKVLGSCIIDNETMITLDFNKSFDSDKVSYYSKRCNEELAHLVNIAATHGQKLRIFKSKARIQVQKCSSLYSSEGYSTLVETLLEAIQPNFVLCVGNTNDQDKPMTSCEESMFSTLYGHGINRDHLYTVAMTTKKCTMANWELRDSTDMVDLFKQLVEIKKEGV
ncbi:glycosyltransferase family 20 protein [Mucor lusitanicus]|uniref:Glycosyltransferase family 20 protein n=2 Tax=Mucor circinelloides f. lusitanicus TaxID=29924 RepID=A0A168HIB0_MUCCL|nr:glycosyltransferase family 20 protein [Mucor lusitanicus]OAC98820.1 glycosyltransferase family 20 protein [Mucor lusitanicus CBS 277.49]